MMTIQIQPSVQFNSRFERVNIMETFKIFVILLILLNCAHSQKIFYQDVDFNPRNKPTVFCKLEIKNYNDAKEIQIYLDYSFSELLLDYTGIPGTAIFKVRKSGLSAFQYYMYMAVLNDPQCLPVGAKVYRLEAFSKFIFEFSTGSNSKIVIPLRLPIMFKPVRISD